MYDMLALQTYFVYAIIIAAFIHSCSCVFLVIVE